MGKWEALFIHPDCLGGGRSSWRESTVDLDQGGSGEEVLDASGSGGWRALGEFGVGGSTGWGGGQV